MKNVKKIFGKLDTLNNISLIRLTLITKEKYCLTNLRYIYTYIYICLYCSTYMYSIYGAVFELSTMPVLTNLSGSTMLQTTLKTALLPAHPRRCR